jgi:hypothetical protein
MMKQAALSIHHPKMIYKWDEVQMHGPASLRGC